MDEIMFDSFTEVHTAAANLLDLLSCRQELEAIYGKEHDMVKVMDSIIGLELNVAYIDSSKACGPIVEEFNTQANKKKTGDVVSIVKKKE